MTYKGQYILTLHRSDIGKDRITGVYLGPGKSTTIFLGPVIGKVTKRDVGKQVYMQGGVIRVENDEQFQERTKR